MFCHRSSAGSSFTRDKGWGRDVKKCNREICDDDDEEVSQISSLECASCSLLSVSLRHLTYISQNFEGDGVSEGMWQQVAHSIIKSNFVSILVGTNVGV